MSDRDQLLRERNAWRQRAEELEAENEQLKALLKGIIDAKDAIMAYKVNLIAPYPDGPIPEEVRSEWNRDIDSLAAASLKAEKAARATLAGKEDK